MPNTPRKTRRKATKDPLCCRDFLSYIGQSSDRMMRNAVVTYPKALSTSTMNVCQLSQRPSCRNNTRLNALGTYRLVLHASNTSIVEDLSSFPREMHHAKESCSGRRKDAKRSVVGCEGNLLFVAPLPNPKCSVLAARRSPKTSIKRLEDQNEL